MGQIIGGVGAALICVAIGALLGLWFGVLLLGSVLVAAGYFTDQASRPDAPPAETKPAAK